MRCGIKKTFINMKKIINWLNGWQCGTKWCVRRYLILSLFMFWIGLFFFIMSLCCHASIESDINSERAKAKLPRLTVYYGLQQSSTDKVLDMIANKYFAHTSPKGRTFDSFITAKGIKFSMAGEILARNLSGQELINAWMASPTHKDVILDKYYNKVGCYAKNGLTACHFIK